MQRLSGIGVSPGVVSGRAVILIQRGRGGGLAGAFGGAGGQSAFGTKAGDLFTWITVWAGIAWVLLAILAGWVLRNDNAGTFKGGQDAPPEVAAPVDLKDQKKKDAADAGDKGAAADDDKKDFAPTSDAKTKSDAKDAGTTKDTPAKSADTAVPGKAPPSPAPAKTDGAKSDVPKGDTGKSSAGKTDAAPPAKSDSKK